MRNTWVLLQLVLPAQVSAQSAARLDTPLPDIRYDPPEAASDATVATIKIDMAGRDSSTGPLHIGYSDGTRLTFSFPAQPKVADGQAVGFSEPAIGDDRETIAWIEDIGWCCASYSLPHVLDVFKRGRFLIHLSVTSMIYDFKILPGAGEIALKWGWPHGGLPVFIELYSLKTAKKLGEVTCMPSTEIVPQDAPAWAQHFSR